MWTDFAIKSSLFVAHILVWTLWTILIRSARGDNPDYAFNPLSVIILTETAKFLLSLFVHIAQSLRRQSSTSNSSSAKGDSALPVQNNGAEEGNGKRCYGVAGALVEAYDLVLDNWSVGKYFAVPAIIYALYNSFFYLNMTFFDPVAYRVLINIRILWSGLLVQISFKRRLGVRRWFALALLALGCAVNQMGEKFSFDVNFVALLALVFQSFMSSLGGVYSEVFLKRDSDVSINVKNMYLYGFSIVFNALWVLAYDPSLLLSPTLFFAGFDSTVVAIIFVGAFSGFSTALFLRYLNVILKEYAHSGELFATAILSWLLFGVDLNWRVLVSIILTSISVVTYNTAAEMEKAHTTNASQWINPLDKGAENH
jgi:drug/metabolite transporter (DMT)-like permease